jgi:hypothetical protein
MHVAAVLLFAVVTLMSTAGASTLRAASAAAPVNSAAPMISGTTQEGMTLSASSGSWTSATDLTFAYQWQRCDATGGACADISGAAGQTYTLAAADVGHTLRISVTATSSDGSASASSDPTAVVTAADAPLNTAAPSISGEARQGQTLTASAGSWQGTGPIAFGYQWQRCDGSGGSCASISGGTATTYTLTSADVGHTLRVLVTATNLAGSASAVSGATAAVASPGTAPANTKAPSISGSLLSGQTLSLDRGGWSGTGPIAYAYAWQRCDANGNGCAAISGATEQAYKLVTADVGHRLRGAVTATNAAGSTTAYSAASAVVVSQAPLLLIIPAISGKTQVGATLSATNGKWTGASPITYYYQWVRQNTRGGWDPIAGAVRTTYTLTSADSGRQLFVQVKAQNAYGYAYANSAKVGPIGSSSGSASGGLPAGATKIAGGRISIPVTSVSLPQRLVISNTKYSPSVIRSRAPFIARYRVTDTRGYVVRDALVYALGLPYGWVAGAAEVRTDVNGWATIQLTPRAGLPRRGAIVLYVRARKDGDRIIAGVTAQRLTQVLVRR